MRATLLSSTLSDSISSQCHALNSALHQNQVLAFLLLSPQWLLQSLRGPSPYYPENSQVLVSLLAELTMASHL